MKLFGRKRDEVAGEAKIVSMAPTAKAARQTGKLDVDYEFRLDLDGHEVALTCRVPHAKMPAMGQVVPVLIAGDDVTIDFDRMPDIADRARAAAAAAAAGDDAGVAGALGFTLKDDTE